MKKYIHLLIICIVVLLGSCSNNAKELEERISKTPNLYTVELSAQVVVSESDHSQNSNLLDLFDDVNITSNWVKNLFGTRKAMVPVKANLKCGIDWSKITYKDILVNDKVVTITLPQPIMELESSKILYHEIISESTGLRDEYSNEDYYRLATLGEVAIVEKNYSEVIKQAQENAKLQISGMLAQLGYKTEFKDNPEYSTFDIKKFLKFSIDE